MANKEIKVKLVLLGEAATGKTSLATRFAKGVFSEFTESTIGAAFLTRTLSLTPGTAHRLEIWDTAGQERFHSLAPMYYRAAMAAIVCYDVTSRQSYERALMWVEELRKEGPAGCVVALAGLKADLASMREVPEDEARAFALDHALLFAECSAKTEFGVDALFDMIVRRLPSDASLSAPPPAADVSSPQGLDPDGDAAPRPCC